MKISNKLIISPTDSCYENAKVYCKNNLELSNPKFQQAERMGFWTGNIPRTIRLYTTDSDNLYLPFGCYTYFLTQTTEWEIDFANNPPNEMKGKIDLYDYQEVAVQKMANARNGILIANTGAGKGLPLNAKIYTPNGYKRNGDLKIGDEVCNSYGGISKVTGIFNRGNQSCYEITFTDGVSTICDGDHLWKIKDTRSKKWIICDAKTLFKNGISRENGDLKYEIPIAEPVCFNEKQVTIDPWLMGVILGDGSTRNGSVKISNSEEDIVEKIKSKIDGELTYLKGVDYSIKDNNKIYYRLEDYGLSEKYSYDKFIPKDYIYNSISVRLGVLQGIIDSDGSVNGTGTTITSTSYQLIKDCLEIVQSLGGTGKISERHTKYTYKGEKKEGRVSYRLHFKLYKFVPYTSKKHFSKSKPREKYKNAYRRIKKIRNLPPHQTRCITVDSKDHLYIADNFVVTHNTVMGIELIHRLGKKALWLCHTSDLLHQAKETAERFFEGDFGTITEGKVNIGRDITFCTVQTMAKQDLSLYKYSFDVIIVDELQRTVSSPNGRAMFETVLNNLAARYKYGLTASLSRADGLEKCAEYLVGSVIYEVPREAIADKIVNARVDAIKLDTPTSRSYLGTDGMLNYTKLLEYLCNNDTRTNEITSILNLNSDHYNLILSDRISHLKSIMALVDRQDLCCMIDGSMTSKKGKEQRALALEEMRKGTKRYLFATYSLAKEGLDIPRLDRLYLTTPHKDKSTILQSVGRIRRKFEGKSEPIVYDFVDDNIEYCVKAHKTRRTTYKKIDCIISKKY